LALISDTERLGNGLAPLLLGTGPLLGLALPGEVLPALSV
jgi:hypothetical protein